MFSIDFSRCELQDLLAFVLLCMKLPEENVIRVESIWSDSYHKIFVVHSQNFTKIFIGKIIYEYLSYQRAWKTEIFESLELSCSSWASFKLKTNLTTVTVFLYKVSFMKMFTFFFFFTVGALCLIPTKCKGFFKESLTPKEGQHLLRPFSYYVLYCHTCPISRRG